MKAPAGAASIDGIVSALKWAADVDGHDWMPKQSESRLRRMAKGLHQLMPHVQKQSHPMTLSFFLWICNRVEALEFHPLIRTGDGALRLSYVQWKARGIMAILAMLRSDDHSEKAHKMMMKCCVQQRGSVLMLLVPPGKRNAKWEPTFHHVNPLDKECPVLHFLNYYNTFGFKTKKSDVLLWPIIVKNGDREKISWNRQTPVKDFVTFTIKMARIAGVPDWCLRRITGHSFRSGGCTDLLAAGAPEDFVQMQGRWSSTAYKIYIRHSFEYGGAVSARLSQLLRHSWSPQDSKTKRLIASAILRNPQRACTD